MVQRDKGDCSAAKYVMATDYGSRALTARDNPEALTERLLAMTNAHVTPSGDLFDDAVSDRSLVIAAGYEREAQIRCRMCSRSNSGP
jgi:hypothetical protein